MSLLSSPRLALAALSLGVIVTASVSLGLPSLASADGPAPTPTPQVVGGHDVPKPAGRAAAGPAVAAPVETAQPVAPTGQPTDVAKPPTAEAPAAAASTAAPWAVSLTTSIAYPVTGQTFTLTASANHDVGPTPYYIEIYWGNVREARCGFGTTCSVGLYGPVAGVTYPFQARIAFADGSHAVAHSATVTEHILAPWSLALATSNVHPHVDQVTTLTAFANQNVGPTPYYIEIYLGNTRYASCGFGTSCSVNLISHVAGSYTFQARIAFADGSHSQWFSNPLTVSWG